MPDVDTKTQALLDEGLTQGEVDYLQSGGKNSDGFTPSSAGDEPAKATPAEPDPPAKQVAEPEKPTPQAAPAPLEPVEDGEPEPAKDSPYYPQWKRAQRQLQELRRER